jgi:hypothetical protein
MRSTLFVIAIAMAPALAAQEKIPGIIPLSKPSVSITGSERILTITSYKHQLATRPMELEKINCHLRSSLSDIWVVACEAEDPSNKKPRSFVFDEGRHDGSSCELTVSYSHANAKWNVDIAEHLAARCAHRWVDDDHLEMRP